MPNQITQNPSPTLCRTSARRYLIVPDEEFSTCAVLRAEATADSTSQEAGLAIRQPTVDASVAPAGDIRPTMGGPVEVRIEGQIAITKPGVVEDARFGWVRASDDATTDLQLRQSPHVVGRRVDTLVHYDDTGVRRPVRPKLLSLISGDLLAVWIEQDWSPVYGRNAYALTGVDQTIRWSRLDHETDTWSAPAAGPVPSDSSGPYDNFIAGVDIVQFPDTSEILMFVPVNNDTIPGTTAPRRLFCYVSTDDGANWVERSRRHLDGLVPDITLDYDGDGDVDDTSAMVACSAELLDSGRIVLLLVTENNTWSLTSDNRGAAWTPTRVLIHAANFLFAGHGCGSTYLRNGVAVFSLALRDTVSDPNVVMLLSTGNGVDFSPPITITTNLLTVDATICVSPDGWPHVYGSVHRAFNPATSTYAYRDWLWGRRLKKRDVQISDSAHDLVPFPYSTINLSRSDFAFHSIEGGGGGSYVSGGPGPSYYGFASLDAVEHRGQVVLCAQVQSDLTTSSETQPPQFESALVVYRLNHWQPLAERLGQSHPSLDVWTPGFPAGGYIYNRTWDAYGNPENWNYTPAGAGTTTMTYGGPEGGYMQITTLAAAIRSYADTSLPAPNTSRDGVLRFVCQVTSGGSATADDVAVRLSLFDGVVASTIVVRLQRTGGGTVILLYNPTAAIVYGSATLPNDVWLEVLVCLTQAGTTYTTEVYAREYLRTTDPDWDHPYTLVGGGIAGSAAVGIDSLSWGHFAGGAATSRWKSMHLSRTAEQGVTELTQQSVFMVDRDGTFDRSTTGTGEPQLDSGIENVMRSSIAPVNPPLYVERGASIIWRGEATTQGEYDYAAGHDFAAANALAPPILREWRSVDTSKQIEIVLDADPDGTTGKTFRPDALALFGRNFPEFTLQGSDSDSWGAPTLSYRFGVYDSPGGAQRTTHLWGFNDLGATWSYYVLGRRLTVVSPSGTGPWRPHQFRTLKTGPRFYVSFRNTTVTSGSGVYVYRIDDNTEDTLILARAIIVTDIGVTSILGTSFPYKFAVFASTFASLMEFRYPATYSTGIAVMPNSHVKGFRYLRLLIPDVTHRDEDEAFYRCGLFFLGHAAEFSNPDAQWGWSRSEESGFDVSREASGIGRAVRNSSPRREISVDHSYLAPPVEMETVYDSPEDALAAGKRTWAHWLDVVRRLEVDGIPAALVWEGDRAVGSAGDPTPTDPVPVACDPRDVMLCRVTDPGTIEHVQWEQQPMNLGAGATTVPRPAMVIRGITFTEEF